MTKVSLIIGISASVMYITITILLKCLSIGEEHFYLGITLMLFLLLSILVGLAGGILAAIALCKKTKQPKHAYAALITSTFPLLSSIFYIFFHTLQR
tara:strand:+ start:401 stop:691 length:291 start_codon:yes stop_codon:yes gene_type:complete